MKALFYFILLLLLWGCNNTSNKSSDSKVLYEESIENAFLTIVDSTLYKTYYGKISYDIKGNFNSEYSDSFIYKSLEGINYSFTKDDIEGFIHQYSQLKDHSIDKYINMRHYKKKEGSHYLISDSIEYQFYLSPPLFTQDNKYFIAYCIGTEIKPNSLIDGFCFVYHKNNKTWDLDTVIKNRYTTPEYINSAQSHSYIPQ